MVFCDCCCQSSCLNCSSMLLVCRYLIISETYCSTDMISVWSTEPNRMEAYISLKIKNIVLRLVIWLKVFY
jgi:hypothetical protein